MWCPDTQKVRQTVLLRPVPTTSGNRRKLEDEKVLIVSWLAALHGEVKGDGAMARGAAVTPRACRQLVSSRGRQAHHPRFCAKSLKSSIKWFEIRTLESTSTILGASYCRSGWRFSVYILSSNSYFTHHQLL
jgi:hypothetical protein